MPAGLSALDGYGVPTGIASRLTRGRGRIDDVYQGPRMPAIADLDAIDLRPFERELLLAVRAFLPSRAYA